MCGRFNLTATPEQIIETFKLPGLFDFQASYNITPGQEIIAIVSSDGSHRGNEVNQAVSFMWGLVPSWAKDRKISSHLINARAETVAEKPSFRSAFLKRRCLIPATGFFVATDRTGQTGLSHYPFRPIPFCFCRIMGTLGAGR